MSATNGDKGAAARRLAFANRAASRLRGRAGLLPAGLLPAGLLLIGLLLAGWSGAPPASAEDHPPRWLERLDRGVAALDRGPEGVVVSWRLRGDDEDDATFDVFLQQGEQPPRKCNPQPLAGPTFHVAEPVSREQDLRFLVRAAGEPLQPWSANSFRLPAGESPRDYLAIPLEMPPGYHANDASVGDLNGDGRYELVVHAAGRGRDNSQPGETSEPRLQAYDLDGRRLWEIRLGRNIREGAHYAPFLVYDFDGDGRAEVVCRTADGVVDGAGQVLGDPTADHRYNGYVLRGPEFVTVFEGATGRAVASAPYQPRRGADSDDPSPAELKALWGDDYGNRVDRFLACPAYLDGERPSIVLSRGYYARTVIVAWDWREGRLTRRWLFDSDQQAQPEKWRGQGNHSVSAADVDGDGRDEVVFGAMVIDDDGQGLYSTELGHGDAQHTSDLDPSRPGLETWSIHEKPPGERPGVSLRDAASGRILFAGAEGVDVARGLAADIDRRFPGCELWGGDRLLRTAQGDVIGPRPRSANMAVWWDGDLLRELLDGVRIEKWLPDTASTTVLWDGRRAGLAANNGSKANPCLVADLLGDWREEVVARTADNRELRIYVTPHPTEHRLRTLMHDAMYRQAVAWQNVGYNQPPHPSFFLGEGMTPPRRPRLRYPAGAPATPPR